MARFCSRRAIPEVVVDHVRRCLVPSDPALTEIDLTTFDLTA
ncbi:hypothetical protein AB0C34_27885 [Nocardia sp. NPDC049220]